MIFRGSQLCVSFCQKVAAVGQSLAMLIKSQHDGFWLGWHDLDWHRKQTAEHYAGQSLWCNKEFNSSGLFPVEELAVCRYFKESGQVLVVGAGGGREVLALEKLGYNVVGEECNSALVDFGNSFLKDQNAKARIELVKSDRISECQKLSYDGILVGWGVYLNVCLRASRVELLKSIRMVMRPEAALVLGYCRREQGQRYYFAVARSARWIARLRGNAAIELGTKLEPTIEVHLSRDQLQSELAEAGFQVENYWDSNIARAIVVAKVA